MWMWQLDHKEGWALKTWCLRILMLEKTLESPLDSKEINAVNPKGNQPWIFIGKTDAEASILWSRDAKGWHIGKDPDAGKDWRQKENGRQRMGWFDSITDSADMNMSKSRRWWRTAFWCATVCWVAKSRISNWTTTTKKLIANSKLWLSPLYNGDNVI